MMVGMQHMSMLAACVHVQGSQYLVIGDRILITHGDRSLSMYALPIRTRVAMGFDFYIFPQRQTLLH